MGVGRLDGIRGGCKKQSAEGDFGWEEKNKRLCSLKQKIEENSIFLVDETHQQSMCHPQCCSVIGPCRRG